MSFKVFIDYVNDISIQSLKSVLFELILYHIYEIYLIKNNDQMF
jgi:hypothetical protein